MKCSIVRELDRLEDFLKQKGQLHCAVVQGLDLRQVELNWERLDCQGAVFLGCHFPPSITVEQLSSKGALIFPHIPNLPYLPYRNRLYTRAELMDGWAEQEDRSVDKSIYDHFVKKGGSSPDVLEALGQRLHDHAIDNALEDLLGSKGVQATCKKVIGIMGGHGVGRDDPYYVKVVWLARALSLEGYFIASGGGPGTMEAANLGAWLKNASNAVVQQSLDMLAYAPLYTDQGYMSAAQEVLDLHPDGNESLAVPTWFYGHEPTNLFSVHIAKYFSNSIREDGLLEIATDGVVFAPGSAGTTQEIFMDATQNHYVTFGSISPMVFLGRERYLQETQLYSCLSQLAEGREYADYLACLDEVDEIVSFIKSHPPKRVDKG